MRVLEVMRLRSVLVFSAVDYSAAVALSKYASYNPILSIYRELDFGVIYTFFEFLDPVSLAVSRARVEKAILSTSLSLES